MLLEGDGEVWLRGLLRAENSLESLPLPRVAALLKLSTCIAGCTTDQNSMPDLYYMARAGFYEAACRAAPLMETPIHGCRVRANQAPLL